MTAVTHQVSPTPPELILWDVIKEHLDEAVFHFEQWQRGLSSPVFVLDQITDGFEDRIEQHITGFLKAGAPAAERLLYPELEEMTSPTLTTIAALVLLRLSQRNMLYELLDFLSSSQDAVQRNAIIRAMTLNEDPRFETILREAYTSARSPREKAMLLEVFAEVHLDPAELLGDCFDTGFTGLDVAAIKVAGSTGRRDVVSAIERNLYVDNAVLKSAAMEAGLFLGSSAAFSVCRELAKAGGAQSGRAMLFVAMLGSVEDHRIIHDHLDNSAMREAALFALGFTGRVESAELCLQYLERHDKRTAKLAAEAFGAITGFSRLTLELYQAEPEDDDDDDITERNKQAALEQDDLEIDEDITERDGAPTLEQDDLDAELVPDGTDDLLLLDPYAMASWYERKRDTLSRETRYLAGKTYCASEVASALRTFPMRRRHELALELAIRTGAQRWVTADAFTTRQSQELEALESLTDSEFIRRFDDNEAE